MRQAGIGAPYVASLPELRVSFVCFLQREKPDLLQCKVEQKLRSFGHKVLWTPPYCPELQPIELFWAARKNHVAL